MAKNISAHQIGRKGARKLLSLISDAGYSCDEIKDDYGEDIYLNGHDNDFIVEPFRIFFQVKTIETKAKVDSDWTIYDLDISTVRKWILGNELTILVKYNIDEDRFKYCIPEFEITYRDLALKISDNKSQKFYCKYDFDIKKLNSLIWLARVRNYDRILRLTHPLLDIKNSDVTNIHSLKKLEDTNFFTVELLCKLDLMNKANIENIEMKSDTLLDAMKVNNGQIRDDILYDAIVQSLIFYNENDKLRPIFNLKVDIDDIYDKDMDFSPFNIIIFEMSYLLLLAKLNEYISDYNLQDKYDFILFQCATCLTRLILMELDEFRSESKIKFDKFEYAVIAFLLSREDSSLYNAINKDYFLFICKNILSYIDKCRIKFNVAKERVRDDYSHLDSVEFNNVCDAIETTLLLQLKNIIFDLILKNKLDSLPLLDENDIKNLIANSFLDFSHMNKLVTNFLIRG